MRSKLASLPALQPNQPLAAAHRCLIGISIGDAFGESFFGEPDMVNAALEQGTVPASTWDFTDDTIMAIAVYAELLQSGNVNPDSLARRLAHNYVLDPRRGYGGTAHSILRQIAEGQSWREVSKAAFDGMGSMGNGAAVRSGPVGAYLMGLHNIPLIHNMAIAAAQVTHFHPDGIAGAVAVAASTALATQLSISGESITPKAFIETVASFTPESDTKYKIAKAATFGPETHTETLKAVLGNGSRILSQDTVPFAVWCAAHHLGDFEAALWKAISVLGDRDTICAIVAGIVIISAQDETVPKDWQMQVEDWEQAGFS